MPRSIKAYHQNGIAQDMNILFEVPDQDRGLDLLLRLLSPSP